MKTIEIIESTVWQEVFASTILHSLWQGALIVLLMWMLRMLYRNNPKVLYALSLTALVLIVLTSMVTFAGLIYEPAFQLISITSLIPNLDQNIAVKYINQIWLFGCIAFCFRFIWSNLYIKRIIKFSDPLTNDAWSIAFQRVCNHYKIQKSIVLLQSEKIGSAFLTGVLKPVILIPTAWINQLTVKEAECILAHEVSHALNKDHWVNLMMNLIEIIYFYNPAVHILLSHLKLERELLADASASNYINSKLEYAKLIVKIEESSGLIPAFSLPFFRQKKQLRKRIETVLNISGTKSEKYSGFAIMILMASMAFIKVNPNKQESICIDAPDMLSTITQTVCLENKKVDLVEKKVAKPNVKKKITAKRINKYEALNTNQDLALEVVSNQNFTVEPEKAIQNELNQKTKVLLQVKQTGTEANLTSDGGSWIVTKQIRCYAPEEERTIIIVRMNKNTDNIVEPGQEVMDPGRTRNDNHQIN